MKAFYIFFRFHQVIQSKCQWWNWFRCKCVYSHCSCNCTSNHNRSNCNCNWFPILFLRCDRATGYGMIWISSWWNINRRLRYLVILASTSRCGVLAFEETGVPHFGQNFPVSEIDAPHFLQNIIIPPNHSPKNLISIFYRNIIPYYTTTGLRMQLFFTKNKK